MTAAAGATVVIFCYALGANPAASATAAAPPFALRLYAPDSAFDVAAEPFSSGAHGGLALEALHAALARSPTADGDYFTHSQPRRRALASENGVAFSLTEGAGVLAVVAANRSGAPKRVAATVYAKSAAARGAAGELANDRAAADAYYERRKALTPPPAPGAPRGFQYRYPAKWKAFHAAADLAPGRACVVAVVVRSGVQYDGRRLTSTSRRTGRRRESSTPRDLVER